ncbi:hypothetical protein L873DRAFT_1815231 [Choiromyces venosus 120613-1]|uniref:Uncharacterized protein n=1 Tax=Choiromyces venosus 120613-1 TaxID=1336337 RepID=A0A3N4JA68_9PEZI|nr:hypothetical protein L873DRAFT_1815231 [Choiromyces venosus 120613-1]
MIPELLSILGLGKFVDGDPAKLRPGVCSRSDHARDKPDNTLSEAPQANNSLGYRKVILNH